MLQGFSFLGFIGESRALTIECMGGVRLSKSKVMKGLQCPKALYLAVHQPDLARETPTSLQAVFDQGHRVGVEAQKRYPGGVLIEAPHTDLGMALQRTQEAVASGALVLYEATFEHDGVLVRVDILHREKVGAPWHLVEVKSTTQVKHQHIEDAAVQAWVLGGAGVQVESVSIMHINHQCVFPDLSNLFRVADISKPVSAAERELPQAVAQLKKVLQSTKAPVLDIGPHCDVPYECDFKDHCWGEKKIPDISVFDIPGLASSRKWAIYAKGIVDLAQLVDAGEELNPMQRKMVEVTLSSKRALDRNAVDRAISEWEFPLSFLDFETIGPAIPRYPGTRPFEQVPFQFSCHSQMKRGGELTHAEYLHDSMSDPREPLILALIAAVGKSGSVVAYNKGFERSCLTALGRAFPAYEKELLGIAARLVDPLPIFRAHVYDREFRGSFSIKRVAPALLGDNASYEGMMVADGAEAQVAFEEMIADGSPAERKAELRRGMLEYCRQDTVALVGLVGWLGAFTKGRIT